jgi:ankyrin repeat protein
MSYHDKEAFNKKCHQVATTYLNKHSALIAKLTKTSSSFKTAKSIANIDSLGMDDSLYPEEQADNCFQQILPIVLNFLIECMLTESKKPLFDELMPIVNEYYGITGAFDDPLYRIILQCLSNCYSNSKYSVVAVSCRDQEGNTPLHLAVISGDVEIVKALLVNGAQPNIVNNAGKTSVSESFDKPEIFNILLQYPGFHYSPTDLCEAVRLRRKKVVAQLLSKKSEIIFQADSNGKTALYIAVENDHKAMVELLLTHDADMHRLNLSENQTPFSLAFSLERNDIFQIFLDHLSFQSEDLRHVFFEAIIQERIKDVELILKKANEDLKTGLISGYYSKYDSEHYGKGPLYLAVEENYFKMAELLLLHGADVHQRYKKQDTPFALAYTHKDKLIFSELMLEMAPLSKSLGCVLLDAAEQNDLATIKQLLSKNVNFREDPNATGIKNWSRDGKLVLHYAVENNNAEMVSILREHGADPNQRTSKKDLSAIEFATAEKIWSMVKALGGEVPAFADELASVGIESKETWILYNRKRDEAGQQRRKVAACVEETELSELSTISISSSSRGSWTG